MSLHRMKTVLNQIHEMELQHHKDCGCPDVQEDQEDEAVALSGAKGARAQGGRVATGCCAWIDPKSGKRMHASAISKVDCEDKAEKGGVPEKNKNLVRFKDGESCPT